MIHCFHLYPASLNIVIYPHLTIKASILEKGYSWTFYSLGHILELNLGSLAEAGLGIPWSFYRDEQDAEYKVHFP